MTKPHPSPSQEYADRLATRVRECLNHLVPKGSQDPSNYLKDVSQELFFNIVARASEFFAYCPDDFYIQSHDVGGSTIVFGGTNRLLWSINSGFHPDPSYCTDRFKAQFEGEFYEPIGKLWMGSPKLGIIPGAGDAANAPEDTVPILEIPMSRPGVIAILGRKSRKGDGKLAEVKFFTGVEA